MEYSSENILITYAKQTRDSCNEIISIGVILILLILFVLTFFT